MMLTKAGEAAHARPRTARAAIFARILTGTETQLTPKNRSWNKKELMVEAPTNIPRETRRFAAKARKHTHSTETRRNRDSSFSLDGCMKLRGLFC